MRKRLTGALAAAAVVAATAAIPVAAAGGQGQDGGGQRALVVYVAPDGGEDASGSRSDPFATVEQARDALAGRTSERQPGRVVIREGVYQMTESVVLSGEANSHVTYAAAPGEEVEFTGVTTLPAEGFVPLADVSGEQFSSGSRVPEAAAGSVYAYDLGAESIPTGEILKNGFNWKPQPFQPQLMTDDVVQTLAQYPNGANTFLDKDNLSTRVGPQGARDFFSDKTPDGSTMPYEEMLELPGPVFTAVDPAVSERFETWAPPFQPDGGDAGDNTRYETDGWLSGYFGNNYANDRVRIASISPEGLNDEGTADGYHLRTTYPTMYFTTDKWTSFVAQNVLGELDSEGEYYIDRYEGNDVLYYYPPGGTVADKDISLTSFDQPFFTLENVTGVTLEGLRLNGSTSSGVRMLDCESCTVDGAEILNVSLDAVQIGEATDTITAVAEYRTSRGGHDNRVINSELHDLGGGGVFLAGGDRDSLERGNNLVAHNEIYNFSRLATYTPAGYLYGVGNTFRHNYVHDAPHMAIQIMGNDMRVLHNRFENLVTNASDQGVIYAGRDFTYLNNEIAYNFFRDVGEDGNQAIYMDDGMSGMVIHHNVFDTAQHGLFYNSGHSNTATDNVFLDVTYVGHDKLYHENDLQLPVSNAKVVIERFNDMLLAGDGSGFTNTAENIERWYDHYADQYPNIRDWYVPADAAGEPCAAVGTDECDAAYVWENPDSVYVPSHNVLARSVLIDTGAFAYTDDADGLSMQTFNPDFATQLLTGDVPADFAFDPETGRFDPRTTSLNEADGFGRSWVRDWNRNVSLEGIGPR